jgi:hypothetical protein
MLELNLGIRPLGWSFVLLYPHPTKTVFSAAAPCTKMTNFYVILQLSNSVSSSWPGLFLVEYTQRSNKPLFPPKWRGGQKSGKLWKFSIFLVTKVSSACVFVGGGTEVWTQGLMWSKAGAPQFESNLHSILLWLFWRWTLANYFPRLASNWYPLDLSLPNS